MYGGRRKSAVLASPTDDASAEVDALCRPVRQLYGVLWDASALPPDVLRLIVAYARPYMLLTSVRAAPADDDSANTTSQRPVFVHRLNTDPPSAHSVNMPIDELICSFDLNGPDNAVLSFALQTDGPSGGNGLASCFWVTAHGSLYECEFGRVMEEYFRTSAAPHKQKSIYAKTKPGTDPTLQQKQQQRGAIELVSHPSPPFWRSPYSTTESLPFVLALAPERTGVYIAAPVAGVNTLWRYGSVPPFGRRLPAVGDSTKPAFMREWRPVPGFRFPHAARMAAVCFRRPPPPVDATGTLQSAQCIPSHNTPIHVLPPVLVSGVSWSVAAALDAGMCTFGTTRNDFTPQWFYQCFDCNLTGDKGCCITCANSCHRTHNLSAVMQSDGFFCDCGATWRCAALKKPAPDSKRPVATRSDEWFHAVNLDTCDLAAVMVNAATGEPMESPRNHKRCTSAVERQNFPWIERSGVPGSRRTRTIPVFWLPYGQDGKSLLFGGFDVRSQAIETILMYDSVRDEWTNFWFMPPPDSGVKNHAVRLPFEPYRIPDDRELYLKLTAAGKPDQAEALLTISVNRLIVVGATVADGDTLILICGRYKAPFASELETAYRMYILSPTTGEWSTPTETHFPNQLPQFALPLAVL